MKRFYPFALGIYVLMPLLCKSQGAQFKPVQFPNDQSFATVSIAQDNNGYLWIAGGLGYGLYKYDGYRLKAFVNDPKNPNSIISNRLECLYADKSGFIWLASFQNGLDRFEPETETFTHYRHDKQDPSSICSDSVRAILEDDDGSLLIGTANGLDRMDPQTGKFTHINNLDGKYTPLSNDHVRALYKDREGTIWIGCGSPFATELPLPGKGGLYRLDKNTGKIIHYLHDDKDSTSLADNCVKAIFEDSRGTFWVGTAGDGLHTLDRKTGRFQHYPYDPHHPEKLSRPPLNNTATFPRDIITFINEDKQGCILIGTFFGGINRYNPVTGKLTHYGFVFNKNKWMMKDTLAGVNETYSCPWASFLSSDGLFWVGTWYAGLYNTNPYSEVRLPYDSITPSPANAFYEDGKGALWVATDNGIVRKDKTAGTQEIFLKQRPTQTSRGFIVNNMLPDVNGNLWLATFGNGVRLFDMHSKMLVGAPWHKKGSQYLDSGYFHNLCLASDSVLWAASNDSGIYRLNIHTGLYTNYRHSGNDSGSIAANRVYWIAEDRDKNIWAGGANGLDKLNKATDAFQHYLAGSDIKGLFVDSRGVLWAGGSDGLYYYDKDAQAFSVFINPGTEASLKNVVNIIEDSRKTLWVSTKSYIFTIDSSRTLVRAYGGRNGVNKNTFSFAVDYLDKNGKLFLGDQAGYYSFLPSDAPLPQTRPQLNLTGFRLAGKDVLPGPGNILTAPLSKTKEIKLHYYQNSFSFTFIALHYATPGQIHYLYMLKNYDDAWRDVEAENIVYFFNIPPGYYTLKVKAVDESGAWDEKDIGLLISPPWWQTWWVVTLAALSFTGMVWGFFYYRSRRLRRENRLLEEKVVHRTAQLEKSLNELKATQTQLIHSEKMASLGELTAGIAHEIQNPLNFMNNFSEINKELLLELNEEIEKGNYADAKTIARDVIANEDKINHHGKRADAIVKGMLQHSRKNTGQKEPTNINVLADEYLRLSYHGLRAKDKAFNATMQTIFDETIGKINIVPQDIGRVLLNLYNNAFYAVNEKAKVAGNDYKPSITVTTKQEAGKVSITVADNGNGIPSKIKDKIFQPFFTTKPTGQGTGLGLSLSYDIVKAHGGEISVAARGGEGTEFMVTIPISPTDAENSV